MHGGGQIDRSPGCSVEDGVPFARFVPYVLEGQEPVLARLDELVVDAGRVADRLGQVADMLGGDLGGPTGRLEHGGGLLADNGRISGLVGHGLDGADQRRPPERGGKLRPEPSEDATDGADAGSQATRERGAEPAAVFATGLLGPLDGWAGHLADQVAAEVLGEGWDDLEGGGTSGHGHAGHPLQSVVIRYTVSP